MSRKITTKTIQAVLRIDKRLSLPEAIAKQRAIAATAVQSVRYHKSKPLQQSLTTWTLDGDTLEKLVGELSTLETAAQAKREAVLRAHEEFDRSGHTYRNDVENAAAEAAKAGVADPATVVRELGLSVKGERAPIKTSFGPPATIKIKTPSPDGTLALRWKKAQGAKSYLVQTATDVGGPWSPPTGVGLTRTTLTGLPSGKKVWVRVASVGSKTTSDWSAPVPANVA